MNGERKTVATFNLKAMVIMLAKTNPVYTQEMKYEDKQAMHKSMWYVLHSPKLIGVSIITEYYSQDIMSMIKYCEMIGLPVVVGVNGAKYRSSAEFLAWFTESQQTKEEVNIARECIDLMVKEAPELLPIAKRSNEELIEVLQSQVRNSGYDVSMQSIFNQDGLNSGVIEDKFGKPQEWSRTYTKRYERYNTQLKDLLLMYISCKFYAKAGFEPDFNNSISESDVDSYTGGSLIVASPERLMYIAQDTADPIDRIYIDEENAKIYCKLWNDIPVETPTLNKHTEDVVVPQSACSLGVQNYMS